MGDGYEQGTIPAGGLVATETGEWMNRAFFIILVAVALVALGYIVVLRSMGFAPGYVWLAIAVALLMGTIWWARRRTECKMASCRP